MNNPPQRLALGRWQSGGLTEGLTMRPDKPAKTVRRAKQLRRTLSLPESMLWRFLKTSPNGHKFRKQHPAGPYDLDFFCARANLAIEVDGLSHDMGDRPQRDDARTAWLLARRIDTLRIAARDVLADVVGVADMIVAVVEERKAMFGKAPPSVLWTATSPTQVVGEDMREKFSPSTCDGEVARQSRDGGAK